MSKDALQAITDRYRDDFNGYRRDILGDLPAL